MSKNVRSPAFEKENGRGRRRGPTRGRNDLQPARQRPRRIGGQRDLQALLGIAEGPHQQIGRDGDLERRRGAHGAPDLADRLVAQPEGHVARENARARRRSSGARRRRAARARRARPRTAAGAVAPVVEIAPERLIEKVGNRRPALRRARWRAPSTPRAFRERPAGHRPEAARRSSRRATRASRSGLPRSPARRSTRRP